MRNTLRLLATVKPGRFLEAENPTGLTGLFTHPAPRSTLLSLYGDTLDQLKAFPDHSVYRRSTEALTRHRMNIIQSIKPEGYDEWAKAAAEKVEKYPDAFHVRRSTGVQDLLTVQLKREEEQFRDFEEAEAELSAAQKGTSNANQEEVDGNFSIEEDLGKGQGEIIESNELRRPVDWEPEPPLDASQISDVETQIGGGLIEEVIQVAEGELNLVKTMAESKVWEELEEKPEQGQWDTFARDQHTTGTQEPPNK